MMKQILVQLEPHMYAELQKLVPASSRKRSEFIRNAIAQALMELQEVRTEAAYRKYPQEPDDHFDPLDWAPESEAIHPEDWDRAAKPRKARATVRSTARKGARRSTKQTTGRPRKKR